MGMIERFKEYTDALEAAYHDDDWSRLAPYFAPNATYRSYYGGDLEVTGRVKNTGTATASQVRVRVRIIGNDGIVAAQAESELQPGTLAPGASAPFTTFFQYDGPVGTISTEIVWSQ